MQSGARQACQCAPGGGAHARLTSVPCVLVTKVCPTFLVENMEGALIKYPVLLGEGILTARNRRREGGGGSTCSVFWSWSLHLHLSRLQVDAEGEQPFPFALLFAVPALPCPRLRLTPP